MWKWVWNWGNHNGLKLPLFIQWYICILLLVIYYLDNYQQMDACELIYRVTCWHVFVLALWSLMELWGIDGWALCFGISSAMGIYNFQLYDSYLATLLMCDQWWVLRQTKKNYLVKMTTNTVYCSFRVNGISSLYEWAKYLWNVNSSNTS